ncbi:LOW QUALITY PROTEIN: hypothetical protein QTO34_019483 [Cnephaeus nilssonii]|uniref:Ig-like domain-containing protein n=1 Tax=Cnephaeus nilssonii TaxID=3371016 RepID=A0AA40HWT8_CNENI|nr:LOW QUALITY PROTEIN: hypothetical protein QTO34_019483 [Eptesicus nilssonii]
MVLLLISVLEVIFALRGTGAQSATQPDGHVTVSEGAPLELRCKYSSSTSPYLYWYVQYPNQGLQLLLKYFSGDPVVKGMKVLKLKNETSFNLKKHSAQWSDSAVYFCAVSDTVTETAGGAEHKPSETLGLSVTQELSLAPPAEFSRRFFCFVFFFEAKGKGWWSLGSASTSMLCYIQITFELNGGLLMNFSRRDIPFPNFPSYSHTDKRGTSGGSVNQTEGPVTLLEGAFLTLKCTYKTTYSDFLFWYVQYQNKEPVLLLKSSSDNQEVSNRGFRASLVKTDSTFHLKKSSVQVSDSAVYYCALVDTVREAAGELSTNPEGLTWG